MNTIGRIYGNEDCSDTRTCPLQHRIRAGGKMSMDINYTVGHAYLVFPITTPTRSPFFTPNPTSPLARALMCLSNSLKSQAKCPSTPMFRDKGPPWVLGRSCRQMRAGWSDLRDNISAEKYSGRVLLSSGGSRAPSTAESVIRRKEEYLMGSL